MIRTIFGISLVFALGACSDPAPVEEAAPDPRPVKLVTIGAADIASTNRYPAVIDAGSTAELSFVVSGVIESVAVDEAQAVAAGDVIAQLDLRDFRSGVTQARAAAQSAEDEYQRAVRLAEQDAIATSVLEQRLTQRDVTQSQLEQAEKALSDATLRSPFAGTVAMVPVRANQTVSPGTLVAAVIDMTSLKARIDLPASVISTIESRQDQSAAVVLDVAPDQEIPAEFLEANLVADATSQTYSITFGFSPPEQLLTLPGMNATVVLRSTGAREAGAVSVPLAAIQSDGDGQYVWVVEPESMTVSRRAIEVAPGVGDSLTIVAGLALGERIVGAGGAFLSAGAEVVEWTP